MDFIQKLNDLPKIEEGAILCTLDMSSLYTNIPNIEGRIAVARFLNKYRTDNEAFIDHCAEKAKHLLRRKYPREVILKAFLTA